MPIFSRLHFSLLGILFMSFTTLAEEIRIYTWEEYLSPAVIAQFEKQTGHTVKQVYFENEHLRDEVVSSGRAEIYDLIIVDSMTLRSMAQNGLMHDYRSDSIPNRIHISPQAVQACGKAGIPYTWGTMGISYRASQFDHPVHSWNELFFPSPAHYGKITLPLDDIDTVGAALLALKQNPFTDDKKTLKEAYLLLKSAKPKIKAFRNTLTYVMEHREASDIDLALTYSGETSILNEVTGFHDWQYVLPDEGSLLWYECFASLASHPPSEATLAFLNFINQPEIAAKNADEVWTATTNKAALKFVSDEYLNDKELFPDQSALDASFPYVEPSLEGLQSRSRILSIINKE